MAPAAISCLACGKSHGKLLRCGQCKNVWFCDRECQIVARKQLGHKGANCRAADAAQKPPSAAWLENCSSMPMNLLNLHERYATLIDEANAAHKANTRIGYLAAVENYKEAVTVADSIGGEVGAGRLADAAMLLVGIYGRLGDTTACVRAACSSLRAARASANRSLLVTALSFCGGAAKKGPNEMVNAERDNREQERRNGSPSYGGLDISQEGRISLPTSPAALSRLSLAYHEAAVEICDTALAAAGGRGSRAAADSRRVPLLCVEARARAFLGDCLDDMGEERQRSLALMRQAVALMRQVLRTAGPGVDTLNAQGLLAEQLAALGGVAFRHGSGGMAEAEASLREALALSESSGDVCQTVSTLRPLINFGGIAHAAVGPAEAEVFRSQLNQLLVQMGRSPDTTCSICLEPLARPADGAPEDMAGGGGSGGASGPLDSCVHVLRCDHQFHNSCITTWQNTMSNCVCPLCKK